MERNYSFEGREKQRYRDVGEERYGKNPFFRFLLTIHSELQFLAPSMQPFKRKSCSGYVMPLYISFFINEVDRPRVKFETSFIPV